MKNIHEIICNPTISIIITYYNFGKYIKDCIESILNQTYKNFEIIVVNDCSDDENTKALSDIQNDKVRIINLKENKGQLQAFLEGLKVACGEFICMVDADDILLPNHLKTLLYVHLNYNVALVSSNKGEINEKNEIISFKKHSDKEKISYQEIENTLREEDCFKIKKVNSSFGIWSWNPSSSAMFRKNALDILKYYPDKKFWKSGADKVIFSFLHLIGGSINISATCFLYRVHGQNNFNSSLNTGNERYINENTINRLIQWNKKLRIDAIKMFIHNKKELIEKYNKLNYLKMFLKVIFCIDIKFCTKVLRTTVHKLIKL